MMKTKFLIFAVCIALLSVTVSAQSVKVTPEKVTYKRKGANLPDHKRTFTVRYPRFSGLPSATTETLKNSVDYWKLFETTLDENLDDFMWLERFDYKVTYNKSFVLGIELMMEGSGAYPDGSVKHLVVDLRSGKRVFVDDVFADVPGLLVKIDKAQKAEIAREVANVRKESGAEDAAELKRMIKENGYSASKFGEFSLNEAGVVFYYDYGFPHAIQALEPPGTYFFSWRSLRGHIKRGGLLGKFIN